MRIKNISPVNNNSNTGLILKISLFATGCAGIVAEFVLSTLATYLIGNAIFQWTIVMSIMLFAMGIGSRLSRFVSSGLLDFFIITEFALSILCSISAELSYGLSSFTTYIGLIIYIQAFFIGTLIGVEIPLVTRMNQEYEELRINISGVLEKDYFGALIGGLGFAFFALPKLGLTYTPILLGSINFFVASFVLWRLYSHIEKKKLLFILFVFTLFFLIILTVFAEPVIRYGEQSKYKDKVIYSKQTVFQKIVITKWKEYYWLFINGQEQFSTYDEEKYHEPLVHPALTLAHNIDNILILGGGDGLALREVLKHKNVKKITLVDLDPVMTGLAKEHPALLSINKGSMTGSNITIINSDAGRFIQNDENLYGAVIIDLPDPDSIDLMHLYSKNFYSMVRKHLVKGGIMVTQATSPYFSKKAFLCIFKTIKSAGFSVLPYHNHIPTMGEWGWIMGVNSADITEKKLKTIMLKQEFEGIKTKFFNKDAMISMIYFGKGVFDNKILENVEINTQLNPVLFRYYMAGSWGMY